MRRGDVCPPGDGGRCGALAVTRQGGLAAIGDERIDGIGREARSSVFVYVDDEAAFVVDDVGLLERFDHIGAQSLRVDGVDERSYWTIADCVALL